MYKINSDKSICYNYIENKDDLKKQLQKKGLNKMKGCFGLKNGYLNDTIIELLYLRLEDIKNGTLKSEICNVSIHIKQKISQYKYQLK